VSNGGNSLFAIERSGTLSRMDRIFTPWRYEYITTAADAPGCLFCRLRERKDDAASLIVHRAEHSFVVLNAFPYTSGHVMVAPYQHLDQFDKLSPEAAIEMTTLTQKAETVLRELYRPDGINLGMNIGKAAGAGVAGHIHMHILPRWVADANFMTTVGETRVVPEDLATTYKRIRGKF
jgi:ATP adenylyltransferase